ncbi:MAG TPA: hypothetical protein VM163_00160 [bacterium]|nr:hypothetical protein [bacterium]
MKELSAIGEVAVIYLRPSKVNPREHIAVIRMSDKQRKLAQILNLAPNLIAG